MFKKMKKPIITIAVLLVITGIVLGLRLFNLQRGFPQLPSFVHETIIYNESLVPLSYTGVEVVAENDNFVLSLCFDSGNIELYHIEAGYTWRSSPSDVDLALEASGELWMQNLQSPVVFNFTDSLFSMMARLGNVFNQNAEMLVFRLPDGGVRVFFVFHETGIEIGYDIRLTENGINVDVPPNLVSDNENGPFLTEFIIFPFLGATRSDTDDTGYLFLPDGPGALVHFHLSRDFNNSFIEPVYGRDLAYVTDTNTAGLLQLAGPTVYFPVYGIHRNGNTMMAIVHRGESLADIIGNPANVQTGFNSANARFSYRRSFSVITNAQTGEGFFRFSDETFDEYRSLQFHFLTGENAGWLGMAQVYRAYLADKYGLMRNRQENIPFTLNIIGGDITQGTLGNVFVPTTTFEQTSEMLTYFHDRGIENIHAIISGWQRRGASVRSPDKYPAARQLGGDSGLRQMISHADELGYSVILKDNFSTIAQSGHGVRLRRDTVQNAQGFSVLGGWHLNTSATMNMFNSDWQRLENYGAHGVLPWNFGRFLMTDFNAAAPMGRTMVLNATREMAAHMQGHARLLYFNRPQAFLIQPNAVFMNMPLEGTHLTMLDETVPFFPMALHGYIRYYGTIFNYMSEPRRDMLRALSWGALPSFELMYAASEDLWGLQSTVVLSSQFSRRSSEFIDVYNRFREVYNLISGKVMTDYVEIGSITQVTFENITLYINMGTEDVIHNGITVRGLDFAIRKG